jgi:hypothetical protein
MRYALIFLLFLISNEVSAFSVPPSRCIDSVVVAFDKALLAKDSVSLQRMLDDNMTYGHSNGWIETKKEVVNDLFNGKLTYKQINATDKEIKVSRRVAAVRMKADVDVIVSGTPVHVKLNILQVWHWKHRHWVLVARQSVKI